MNAKISWSTSKTPVTFDRPNILLVEGQDDMSFAAAQLAYLGLGDGFQVHVMNGNKTKWRAMLSVIVDDDWFALHGEAVGLVLDADTSSTSAFQSGCAALGVLDVPAPKSAGEIVHGSRLRAGVAVISGPEGTGALEDLIHDALAGPRLAMASDYLRTVEEARGTPFAKPMKNLTLAYLSGERGFVETLGTAVKIPSLVPPDSDCFGSFQDFLRALAGT